jgi:hypothetical protein
MMKTINGQAMYELLEKAVAERGDAYVYPDIGNCVYLYRPEDNFNPHYNDDDERIENTISQAFGDQTQPACAVGLAISYLDQRLLALIADTGNTEAFNPLGFTLNDMTDYHFTELAINVACAMQTTQDAGHPWGEGLVAAKNVLTEELGNDE